MFEKCVNENITELRDIIYNLTNLHDSYKIVLERGLDALDLCVSDARKKSNQEEAARVCANKRLEYFYKKTDNVEKYLLSVEEKIHQALLILLSCTKRARDNATLSVNALMESIRTCIDSFDVQGIQVSTVSFYLNFKHYIMICLLWFL